jgi:hypothetical protein
MSYCCHCFHRAETTSVGDDEKEVGNELNSGNEYSRMIKGGGGASQHLTMEEKMFLESTTEDNNASNGCTVC